MSASGLRDGSETEAGAQFPGGQATTPASASSVAHVFRSPPPRGRRRRLLTVAMLLCSMAVLALPAGAQEEPTETPEPVAPLLVSGRDSLALPLPAQDTPITVAVTDERDETA